jgi:hypothetical protein
MGLYLLIAVPVRSPSGIGRIAIHSLGSLQWCLPSRSIACSSGGSSLWARSSAEGFGAAEASMLQAVAELRLLIQDSNCAALVTCPSGEWQRIQGGCAD